MTLAIASLKITDPSNLTKYREKAAGALAKHGGKIVNAGPADTVLEGNGLAPDAVALIEFPSEQAASDWLDDPELADVHALRNNAGQSLIYLIPGS